MIKIIMFLLSTLFLSAVTAHEGHNLSPGVFKALHGGVIKVGKQFNIEYLVNGNEVAIFASSHEGKDIDPAEVKLTATGHLPKAKEEALKVETSAKSFIFKVDLKKSHRMELNVTATRDGKTDKFKFQVEK